MLAPRDRRALQWGAAAIILAILAFRVVPGAVAEGRRYLERLGARRELLARGRADLADLPQLEAAAPDLTARVAAMARRVYASGSDAEATATLAATLTQLAAAARLAPGQVVPLADSASAGDLRRVSAHLSLEGDIRGLAEYLDAIGRHPIPIVPTRLRVMAPDPRGAVPGPERLRVELEVQAWYLPPVTGS